MHNDNTEAARKMNDLSGYRVSVADALRLLALVPDAVLVHHTDLSNGELPWAVWAADDLIGAGHTPEAAVADATETASAWGA